MESICTLTAKKFTISEAEAAYCQARGIPLPKLHPHERLQKILSFRNRTFLYNSVCAFSQKAILSQIPPEKGFTVYDSDIWSSEQWDPLSYGQEYDPSRSFFDQVGELLKKVPLPNLTVVKTTLENSDYVNGAVNLKNCYLCFASVNNSDCMFCWNAFNCKNVVDCISPVDSELCYDCRDIDHCYRLYYSQSCNYCSESYFLEGCQSCKNCFGCVNLSRKEYCWYNEQLTAEEFKIQYSKFKMGSYKAVEEEKRKFTEFKKQFPRRAVDGQNNENCTGNFIHNCKDCTSLFHSTGSLDLENCIGANKSKDTFCTAFCRDAELMYNSQAGIGNYNLQFCAECVQCRDLMYCLYCVQSCSDCLGCVSLKKKQYCILNKQYSKEEYEKISAQIKQQLTVTNTWEDFFPAQMSPVFYNQSDGIIILPLTKEEALKRGFSWKDEEVEKAEATPIADTIGEIGDAILEKVLICNATGKKYRVTKPELAFYRQMNIPLPHVAPLERVHQAANLFRITEPQTVHCHQCKKEVVSVYDPAKRPILCEACYSQAMY